MNRPVEPRRIAIWSAVSLCIGSLVVLVAGLGGRTRPAVAVVAAFAFLLSLLAAGRLTLQDHQRRMATRDEQSRAALLAMLAVQLQGQDEAALRKMAGQRGLLGQAASMVLKGRQQRRGVKD